MEKSLKELAWNVTEEEYRKDPAYSYSTLAKFEREGWRNFSTLFDRVETPSLTFGQAVDTLTLPVEGENFEDSFIVCDFPEMSDTLITITKELHKMFSSKHKKLGDISDVDISDTAVRNNYYANARYATFRVKNIREQCEEYYSLLTLAGDKTILSSEEYKDVLDCVNELKTNPYSKEFLVEDPFALEKELLYQLKFKGTYKGIGLRCMFDAIQVDHYAKIITPIDLKTTGHPEEEFEKSFFKWKYYIQARLYTEILRQNLEDDPYFKHFRIGPYRFITINRRTKAPVVWKYEDNIGKEDLIYEGGLYRDWRKIVKDLNYYMLHPDSKYSKEVTEHNGVMVIKNFELRKE